MSRIYDNWEKLVEAVLKREELRELAFRESFSSSVSASSRQSNLSYRDVQQIELREIIKSTRNFHPDIFLGEGVFCQVFKAWIDEHTLTASKPGLGMAVAIRKWRQDCPEMHQDWLKEIHYLIQLRHPNLVELVGYCLEEHNIILVQEFMHKGSLEDHLFMRGHQALSWATRIKVAADAARGLSYLHDQEMPVIHRDFKTANILLDEEFNAKLSNYCYGKDDPTVDMTVSTDQVLFTYGYIPPEYMATGCLTTKCNVYVFGIVLLELLSGRRAYDRIPATKEHNLLEWAKLHLDNKKKLLQIMDAKLEGKYTRDEAYKVLKLAAQCLNAVPEKRPRMAEVVVALDRLQCSNTM